MSIKAILTSNGITTADAQKVVEAYAERHRHWHTERHVLDVLAYIDAYLAEDTTPDVDEEGRSALRMAACYHDVVYDTRAADNEKQSAALWRDHTENFFQEAYIERVERLILETAPDAKPTTWESELLRKADTAVLTSGTLSEMLDYGRAIYAEYQEHDYAVFLTEHLRVLRSIAGLDHYKLDLYEGVMSSRKLRVGIYAGSFNPWHKGHDDVLRQAMTMFDKVVIARGVNPTKSADVSPTLVLRPIEIAGAPRIEVKEFRGPLWKLYDHYNNQTNYDVTIVRGIRGAADLESELVQRTFVRDAAGTDVPYVFLACADSHRHISSSAIRALDWLGADTTRYMP